MNKLLLPISVLGLIQASPAAVVISEIDLTNNKIELVNTGGGVENLTGYFFCNRVTGSPFYPSILATMIVTAESSGTTLTMQPGGLLTFQMVAGFLPDASGEVGLYLNGNNFGSAANMLDYVGYGTDGTRDSVAAAKGIWASGSFVSLAGIAAGQTIQLKQGQLGNGVADYELRPSTIGFNQIPEPSGALLVAMGSLAMLGRRTKEHGNS